MVQAYFRPTITSGLEEATWLGYLQSLWVDEYGNLREDTDGDLALDVTQDKVIKYFTDAVTGDTMVKKFTVNSSTPYPDTNDVNCVTSGTCLEATLEEINPIFEAGKLLAERDPDGRKIFTYIDQNNDGVVDIDDVFAVLSAWGPCDDCPEDINDDGMVDIDDIFAVLAAWGPCP